MYFRSKPEEERHCDNSIMVLPSDNNSIAKNSSYQKYSSQFLLLSGLLGFFISYPFTFLPNFLGILLHFFIVTFVCASLNFLIVFGISDFLNFLLFSFFGFRTSKESSQNSLTEKPLIETNEQVRVMRLWLLCSFH